MLFVIALENFYYPSIKREDLAKVNKCLRLFLSQLSDLYDGFIIKSGVYELLHICKVTVNFGLINNIGFYQFEEINRKI